MRKRRPNHEVGRIKEWLPTSKMTAVGIAGGFVVWGIWALHDFYDVTLEPWVAAFWAVALPWAFGYVVTEHRETILNLTKEIHAMVNSRLTEALDRIIQLDDTLQEANVTVPERPDDE